MSKSIGESLFEVLIMLNFTAKIHFFVRTAKFLTKKLSEIYLFYVSFQPNTTNKATDSDRVSVHSSSTSYAASASL